jgi:hypothetical protein
VEVGVVAFAGRCNHVVNDNNNCYGCCVFYSMLVMLPCMAYHAVQHVTVPLHRHLVSPFPINTT